MNGAPAQTEILFKRLQTFDFLRGLDHETLSALAKNSTWKVFAPDAVVFWEGDTESNLYYLQYGSLKVLKAGVYGLAKASSITVVAGNNCAAREGTSMSRSFIASFQ